ncbi:MAG TPA: M3 family oligoendopeptidase [Oscillatoriaceae cyanobacterium]
MGTAAEETLRWDLARLYEGPRDARLNADLQAADQQGRALRDRYRGKLAQLPAAELREAIAAFEAHADLLTKLRTYTSLAFWADTNDEAIKSLYERIRTATAECENGTKFFESELQTVAEPQLNAWLEAPELVEYGYYLGRIRSKRPHALGEAEERLVATKDVTGNQAWVQLYTEITSRMTVPLDLPDGHKVLPAIEAKILRTDADRGVRRIATDGFLKAFAEQGHVLSYLYNTVYEDHRQMLQMRGYDNPMTPTLMAEDLSPEVIEALLSAVENHYHLAHRYYALKARALGIENFGGHDLYAPYAEGGRQVPYAEARRIILDAYDSFSPAFGDRARGFFDGRYIDVPPAPGKQGGAFCAKMIPGMHPFVLLNYTGHASDVGALAHELGHGVHFLLAGERQRTFNYYPITSLAETASTFGELLTVNRQLAMEKDPVVRRQLLANRIEFAIFTIMLQVVNTRWEQRAHALRAERYLSADDFCRLWKEETGKLYGPGVEMAPGEPWRWATVPHMIQYRFYCYSYAFGQLLVYALYQMYEEEGEAFVPKFTEVLAAGGSAPVGEILGRIGIDIADPGFWNKGLALFDKMLEEFEATVAV